MRKKADTGVYGIVAKVDQFNAELIALIDTDSNSIITSKKFAKSIPSRNVQISPDGLDIDDCDHFLI